MFYLYKKTEDGDYQAVSSDEQIQEFSFAGKTPGSLFTHWQEKGRISGGWEVSIEEFRNKYLESRADLDNNIHFIIDYFPTSKTAVALVEIEYFYAFTYLSPNRNDALWTILMLQLKGIFDKPIENPQDKKRRFRPENTTDIIEFLYLQKTWSPGRVGGVNAALIYNDALKYFLSKLALSKSEIFRNIKIPLISDIP